MFMIRVVLSILLTILVSLQITNAGVYRWKDKNGNIHFSDKPHADAAQVDIKAPKPSGIGISKQQTQRRKELLEKFDEKNKKNKQQALNKQRKRDSIDKYCTDLKNRLRDYKDVDFLFSRDKAGERFNLSDKQKLQEENKLRSQIAKNC